MTRTFERSWISRLLDDGSTMKVHPVNGWSFEDGMFYSSTDRIWYYYVHKGGWDDNPDIICLATISGGRDHAEGDFYPDHWRYDPWTGKNLETGLTWDEEANDCFFEK